MADQRRTEDVLADVRRWAAPRAWLVASATAVGIVAGAVLTVGLAVPYDPVTGSELAFSLGALLLGFGILGWSASIFAGHAIETTQELLDAGSRWTEADSRRAMARVTGFGFGVVITVPPTTVLLRGVA